MAVTAVGRPLGALGRMSVVAAMHVAVLLVLARSFGIIHTTQGPDPIDVVRVDDSLPVDPLPPMPDYKVQPGEVFVDEPEPLPFEPEHTDGGISAKGNPDGQAHTGGGSAQVVPNDVFDVRADPKHPL